MARNIKNTYVKGKDGRWAASLNYLDRGRTIIEEGYDPFVESMFTKKMVWAKCCYCDNVEPHKAAYYYDGKPCRYHSQRDGGSNLKSFREVFWSRAAVGEPTDCWDWLGPMDHNDYGTCFLDKKLMKAHRAAYWYAFGNLPTGLSICHSCNNKKCVNPSHLYAAKNGDNIRDAAKANLLGKKLSAEDVLEIRAHRDLFTGKEMAIIYGVTRHSISNVLRGHTWKHLL